MTPDGRPVAPSRSPLRIEVRYEDKVCYALAYNKVPTIRDITIENVSGGITGRLTVTAAVRWSASATPLMHPFAAVVDAPPMGSKVQLDGSSFRIDDTAIVDVTETTNAQLEITVTDEAGVTQLERRDLTVYARNQWINSPDLHELTAAFVQPNHPSVSDVLSEASRILKRQGRSQALEGYQGDNPKRVAEIGEAIFLALQGFVDHYINPPAGYETIGQKVRPLDEVLAQRQGTCIELACAYASCLEQSGLYPVIFLVHGHAFAGFFVDDRLRAAEMPAVVTDFNTAILWIESGQIIAAETVRLCGNGLPFAEAVAEVRVHLDRRILDCPTCGNSVARGDDPEVAPHLQAIIDVALCHDRGILPLPARVERDGVVTVVIDSGPQRPAVVERYDATTRRLLPETAPARVQQWKNSLLDLTFRNSLLNYKPDRTGISLFPPRGRLAELEDVISAGHPVTVVPGDVLNDVQRVAGFRHVRELADSELAESWDRARALWGAPSSEGNESMIKKLRRLVSRARVEEEETGSNNLFLTIGSLRWSDPRATVGEVVSPIFLIPIRVTPRRGQSEASISIDDGGFTTINYCLIEALRVKHQMTLQWFDDDMRDASGLDIAAGLQALRREILERGLAPKGFDVVDDASIGLLRFGKVRLWRDLDEHWSLFARNPVVAHLVDGGRSQFVDPAGLDSGQIEPPRDIELLNPQPVDGAQANAIKQALAGRSFVLEGPPGTGKSQTITNLLANALARGKKVLFVAEKQAALQVVHERLQQAGLAPFCLELHNKGSRPEDIKTQLRAALDFQPALDRAAWDRIDERFGNLVQMLDTYRDKLHRGNGSPLTYYAAYLALLRLREGPVAEHTRRLADLGSSEVEAYRKILDSLGELAHDAQPAEGHPWAFATASFDALDRVALVDAISKINDAFGKFADSDSWFGAVRHADSLVELSGIVHVLALALDAFKPSAGEWGQIARSDWADEAEALVASLGETLDQVSDITAAIGVGALAHDFAPVREAVAAAVDSFPLGRRGRVGKALGPLADKEPFAGADADAVLSLVERLVRASEDVRSAVHRLRTLPGPVTAPSWFPTGLSDLTRLRTRIRFARSAAVFLSSGGTAAEHALTAATAPSAASLPTLEAIRAFVDNVAVLRATVGATAESWERWKGERSEMVAISSSLQSWVDAAENLAWRKLQRWLSFAAAVATLEHQSLAGFRRQLLVGEIDGDAARDAFDRALMAATLVEVGEARGLDVFDSSRHDRSINEFVETLGARQEFARKLIPADLYESRTFDAQAGRGAVGELRAELGAKRRGARSVRALLSKYPDLILSLTPCFLMSPDSVANFLEPGKINFDLVVFDEASQIPVSSAIGAMGRASSVVVVGDSRQMPPTAVAVARGEEDAFAPTPSRDADAVIADAESILDECLESRLEQEWLAWHYRSRDEVLIDFSNHRYYDRRLSSFPASRAEVPGCGLRWHRVQGQFDHGGKRTNEVEANRIADLVVEVTRDPEHRGDSIGVVTLNLEQRELVEEKLRAINDERVQGLLESEDPMDRLFVLNLESVQGRERDVIILGTGFSKRADGRKMPLNFGPLNNVGGERRLNVAVTRARKKVLVVSSFDPEELADATALGMVHLREYLDTARSVTGGTRPDRTSDVADDDDLHRSAIAEAFRSQGLEVATQVGLSAFKVDLALTVPHLKERWLVGVLLDGPDWADRPLVSDRDALPVTILGQMMGWPYIARIWLPAWRLERDDIVASITATVNQLAAQPEGRTHTAGRVRSSTTHESETADDVQSQDSESPRDETMRAAPPGVNDVPGSAGERPFRDIPTAALAADVAAAARRDPVVLSFVTQLVDTYGPLTSNEVIKRTLRACGLNRIVGNRVAEFTHLLRDHQVIATEFGDYVFPADLVTGGEVDRVRFNWYRASTFAQRKIDEVAPHELANAAVDLVAGAFSIEESDLASELLSVFGYTRRTEEAREYVRRVIRWAVANGYLAVGPDSRLILPNR